MKTYDPNTQFAEYTVRITLQQWDYKGAFEVKLRTNCHGWEVLDSAVEAWLEELADKSVPEIELKNDKGETLLMDAFYPGFEDDMDDDGEDPAENLRRSIVAVEIVECVPEKRGK